MVSKNVKKLGLTALVLMIFTSVFGFTNMPRSFYLMGYSAIPWYILSAITFFIPYAFMMSEYGAAFKEEKGGIYTWMSKSVGPKYAFVGTFMWYASYIIWMVNISTAIWIVLSNAIFGKDTTTTWELFGLNSTQTLGLLGIILITLITFTASRGLEKITRVTSIGGTAVALTNLVLLIGALIVFFGKGGNLAQPFSDNALFKSPNPAYTGGVSVLSFLVFAIFAYGGIEVVGGLVDQTEDAERTFPKGVTFAAIIIAIGYAVGILLCGLFTNWNESLSPDTVHMGNVAYLIMNNLGYQIGLALGTTEATALTLGAWMARYVGISMVLALSGAFFTLSYAPLKQLITGTPKALWPKKMSEIKDGIPVNAMWYQWAIVAIMILLVSFGGEAAEAFFSKLILMTNVAMTLPYMFISGAFPAFKNKSEIVKPFEIYKSKGITLIAAILVTFTVGFANFFTIVEPGLNGDWSTSLWMIAGPLFFTIVALVMYGRYAKRLSKGEVDDRAA